MLFPRAAIAGVTITAALSFPVVANSPPVAAPRTPVTVEQLPAIQETQPTAAAPAVVRAPPPPVPVQKPLWRQPFVYAFIALADTLAASFATIMYLKRPSPGLIRLSAALTASSALFIAAAVAAWLL